jgi:transcriptional repressor NrdR
MFCPFCSSRGSKVLESRINDNYLRRRRECEKCNNRFTTYERTEFQLHVTKKSGKEEAFNFQKINEGIRKACCKSTPEEVFKIAKKVEQKIVKKKLNAINTKEIGKIILTELKNFDKLAYLRYVTVHKKLEDTKSLEKEISRIIPKKR